MLKIKIETDNEAFQKGNKEIELVRCLKDVIEWIEIGREENPIYDLNGNKVGYFKLQNDYIRKL
jgi:hypothetical protein